MIDKRQQKRVGRVAKRAVRTETTSKFGARSGTKGTKVGPFCHLSYPLAIHFCDKFDMYSALAYTHLYTYVFGNEDYFTATVGRGNSRTMVAAKAAFFTP